MKIKIDTKNIGKINAALTAVNGTAVDHTYDADDIIKLAVEAEAFAVSLFDNKKHTVGARYNAESGSKVASAYKYSRISTVVSLERFSTGWFLVAASRGTIWSSGGSSRLFLDVAQDFLAAEKARSRYTVCRFTLAGEMLIEGSK